MIVLAQREPPTEVSPALGLMFIVIGAVLLRFGSRLHSFYKAFGNDEHPNIAMMSAYVGPAVFVLFGVVVTILSVLR